MKISSNQINYLNIGLLILSMLLAFKVPVELFLFAYAVLGPLHYLTEIAWLKERNFFMTGKRDWWFIFAICVVYVGIYFVYDFSGREEYLPWWEATFGSDWQETREQLGLLTVQILFTVLVTAIAMVVFKKTLYKVIAFVVAVVVGALLNMIPFYVVIISTFLPTLIHVFIFTGAFMLFGALKERSTSGYITFALFLVCAFVVLYSPYMPRDYQVEYNTLDAYGSSGFYQLNQQWLYIFGGVSSNELKVLIFSKAGMAIMRFIAFAYTYHYLNWFSKTSVIGWHKISAKKLIAVIVIWVASVALYYYDYKVGLLALLFLSMLHVFLEFPLNYKSFTGIGSELYKIVRRK